MLDLPCSPPDFSPTRLKSLEICSEVKGIAVPTEFEDPTVVLFLLLLLDTLDLGICPPDLFLKPGGYPIIS
ncbi:hypothetical protein Hanom_Chr03g00258511 [Helianthus anomalus]